MRKEEFHLGEAILVGGRMGAVEQKIYKWKQYQANATNTYIWNRYNAVSTTTYRWNKWSRDIDHYTWNRYKLVDVVNQNLKSQSQFTLACNPQGPNNDMTLYGFNSTPTPVIFHYTKFDVVRYTIPSNATNLRNSNRYPSRYPNSSITAISSGYTWYGAALSSMNYLLCKGASSWTIKHNGSDEDGGVYWFHTLDITQIVDFTIEKGKGTLIDTVTSTTDSYPSSGASGSYWYDDRSIVYKKGSTSYGQVTSTSSSAYPSNGASGSYWYESNGSDTTYSKGSTSYSDVSSTDRSAYPDNNYSGSYWYVYSTYTTEWSQGEYVGDRLSTDRDRWPDNGRDGDYWYVFDGEA